MSTKWLIFWLTLNLACATCATAGTATGHVLLWGFMAIPFGTIALLRARDLLRDHRRRSREREREERMREERRRAYESERQARQAMLAEHGIAVADGPRSHTVIAGETGSGKTTFLRAYAAEACDAGAEVQWLTAHDDRAADNLHYLRGLVSTRTETDPLLVLAIDLEWACVDRLPCDSRFTWALMMLMLRSHLRVQVVMVTTQHWRTASNLSSHFRDLVAQEVLLLPRRGVGVSTPGNGSAAAQAAVRQRGESA